MPSTISRSRRNRFSKEPPYSSVRKLVFGLKNCCRIYPCVACSSTQSTPAFLQRTAAAIKSSRSFFTALRLIACRRVAPCCESSHFEGACTDWEMPFSSSAMSVGATLNMSFITPGNLFWTGITSGRLLIELP